MYVYCDGDGTGWGYLYDNSDPANTTYTHFGTGVCELAEGWYQVKLANPGIEPIDLEAEEIFSRFVLDCDPNMPPPIGMVEAVENGTIETRFVRPDKIPLFLRRMITGKLEIIPRFIKEFRVFPNPVENHRIKCHFHSLCDQPVNIKVRRILTSEEVFTKDFTGKTGLNNLLIELPLSVSGLCSVSLTTANEIETRTVMVE